MRRFRLFPDRRDMHKKGRREGRNGKDRREKRKAGRERSWLLSFSDDRLCIYTSKNRDRHRETLFHSLYGWSVTFVLRERGGQDWEISLIFSLFLLQEKAIDLGIVSRALRNVLCGLPAVIIRKRQMLDRV